MNANPELYQILLVLLGGLDLRAVIATVLFLLAYCVIRLLNRATSPRFSYLAVFSSMGVFVHPMVLLRVALYLHLPCTVGGEALKAFVAGLIATITGIIAMVRILMPKRRLRGMPFAIVGIIGGALWVWDGVKTYIILTTPW